MELVKVIESTGVAAIGIHGRYSVHERESHETIVTWAATILLENKRSVHASPATVMSSGM